MVAAIHPLSIFKREFLSRTVDTLQPRVALTISHTATQEQAITVMCVGRFGSVLVIDDNSKVIGIVTERDVLNSWGAGMPDRGASVTKLMTPDPQVIKRNASIARAVQMMASGGYRHLPVIYGDTEAPRVISTKDFVDSIHKRLTSKMLDPDYEQNLDGNVVDQFFGASVDVLVPDPILVLSSSLTVSKALDLIRQRGKGAVVLVDQRHNTTGIFTERDFLMKVALQSRKPSEISIVEVMTPSPRTLPTSASVAVAFGLLSEGGYRHIPLVDGDEKLVGMLSVRNFLSYLSAGILKVLGAGS